MYIGYASLFVKPFDMSTVNLTLLMVYAVLNIKDSGAPLFLYKVNVILAIGVRAKHYASVSDLF